jgi:hypothetical protein
MKTKAEQRAFLERTFRVYETGKPVEIRRARREFEDEWRADSELCVTHRELIFAALARFDEIPDSAHQAALIAGIDLCFFSLADENFAPLRDFILKAIQHSDVRVRDAALRTSEWLDRSLRRRAKVKGASQARAVEEYKDYVNAIELLLDYFDDGSETEAQYIDEMKPSPQRSLEMLLDRVTHGGYELEITHVPPPAILAKREELETKIADLLDAAKSDFCFHDVLEEIYREEGVKDLEVIIEMFEGDGRDGDGGLLAARLDEVIDVVNEAWNYFPHAVLDGLCPMEKMKERQNP